MAANMKHSVMPFTAIINTYKQYHFSREGPKMDREIEQLLFLFSGLALIHVELLLFSVLKKWEMFFKILLYCKYFKLYR